MVCPFPNSITMTDKNRITDLLEAEWQAIADLCADFTKAEWDAPTQCPGWSAKDNVSHIIGTERMLSGDPLPEIDIDADSEKYAHLKNDIAKANEKWIEERRGRPGSEVLEEFKEIAARRIGALREMSQEDFDAPSWTPAGQDTYGRFMQIRLFDSWTHEQDIRQAVGRTGHLSGPVVDETLAEVRKAMGFVVGKLGGAPPDSRVEIRLTGATPATIRVERIGDEPRCAVVDEFSQGEATVAISLDFELFMRLTAGRADNAEAVTAAVSDGHASIAGDMEAGERIAHHLAYVF